MADIVLVTLSPAQAAKARLSLGNRFHPTHAVVCEGYGTAFGSATQCRKDFYKWRKEFGLLFERARETNDYPVTWETLDSDRMIRDLMMAGGRTTDPRLPPPVPLAQLIIPRRGVSPGIIIGAAVFALLVVIIVLTNDSSTTNPTADVSSLAANQETTVPSTESQPSTSITSSSGAAIPKTSCSLWGKYVVGMSSDEFAREFRLENAKAPACRPDTKSQHCADCMVCRGDLPVGTALVRMSFRFNHDKLYWINGDFDQSDFEAVKRGAIAVKGAPQTDAIGEPVDVCPRGCEGLGWFSDVDTLLGEPVASPSISSPFNSGTDPVNGSECAKRLPAD